MVRIQISLELEEDEYGPRATYLERFVLPPWFAEDATDAHAKLLTLLVTARYVELPGQGGAVIPLPTETVRGFAVWEGAHRV